MKCDPTAKLIGNVGNFEMCECYFLRPNSNCIWCINHVFYVET